MTSGLTTVEKGVVSWLFGQFYSREYQSQKHGQHIRVIQEI